MVNATRTQLEPCVAGHPKTYNVRVKGWYDGEFTWLDLARSGWTVLAKLVKPDGTYVAPTVTIPTQVGGDRGVLQVPLTAANLDDTGTWKMNIYIGESSSNEEPITRFYQFECYPDETEA